MRPAYDGTIYAAPRLQDAPRNGRTMHHATCGHNVWIGERGLTAVHREGKRLICGPCLQAWATEHDKTLGIDSTHS